MSMRVAPITLGLCLALAATSTPANAQMAEELACSLEQAPEGYTKEIYEFFVTPSADRAKSRSSVAEQLEAILEQCSTPLAKDGERARVAGFAMMAIHLKVEARDRLAAMGYDVAEADAVIIPKIAKMDLARVVFEEPNMVAVMSRELVELADDAARQTGADRDEVGAILGVYLIGLFGEKALEQVG